jgi:hypothetical protein
MRQIRERNSSRSKNCRLSSTKSRSACAYFSTPSSRSVRRTLMAGELEKELAMLIIASSRTGWANPQS